MKRLVFSACILLLPASLSSQIQQGVWELSLSSTCGSLSTTSETNTSIGTFTSEESQIFFAIAVRPGFYIVDRLAFEPEVFWTAIEQQYPAFSFSANITYNYPIAKSDILPFVLAGYGVGNAIPALDRLTHQASQKLDIPLLNLGAGAKVFVAERIALRVEYRYQRYTQEQTSGYGVYKITTEATYNYHKVLFGFSVFLP